MTTYNQDLSDYNASLFAAHDEGLRNAWEETPKRGLPAISIQPEEGRFLQLMVRSCQARKALEIGTLGGYSGIWIARGLLPGGKLITLEKDPYHAKVAREHFKKAGVDGFVEVRVGDAHHQLASLSSESPFDFVFIDAEKGGYADYYEWAIANLRTGGVVSMHNAFAGGRVLEHHPDHGTAEQMQRFNARVAADARVISVIYPAGDGTLLAVKTG